MEQQLQKLQERISNLEHLLADAELLNHKLGEERDLFAIELHKTKGLEPKVCADCGAVYYGYYCMCYLDGESK